MKFRLRRYKPLFAAPRSSYPPGCLVITLILAAVVLVAAAGDLRALAVRARAQVPGLAAAATTPAAPAVTAQPGSELNASSTPGASPSPVDSTPTAARPTSTPRPTQSSTPSRAPTTAAPTPSLPAALRPSPRVAVSDLLFLSGSRLTAWERRTHSLKTLAEDVDDYALAAGGGSVLLLRAHAMTVNGREVHALAWLDLATGEEITLLDETSLPLLPALSPQGKRAAYLLDAGSGPQVVVLETSGEAAPQTLAACARPAGCTAPAWSPDGNLLAWSDARGIWISDLSGSAPLPTPGGLDKPEVGRPRLAHDHQVQISDPAGETSAYAATFDHLRWSPDGRFISMSVTPEASEVRWQAVLDVRRGYLAGIPDAFAAADEHPAPVVWTAPDALLVAHAGSRPPIQPPYIHFWNVFAANTRLLVSGPQYDLYSDDFPFSPDSGKAIPLHHLDWPASITPGKVWLGVRLPGTQARPALFSLDTRTGKLHKLPTLPLDTLDVLWAPDASGALVVGSGGDFYLASPLEDLPLTRIDLLPADAERLAWLPPAPPKKSQP